jgi:hypothetical protein
VYFLFIIALLRSFLQWQHCDAHSLSPPWAGKTQVVYAAGQLSAAASFKRGGGIGRKWWCYHWHCGQTKQLDASAKKKEKEKEKRWVEGKVDKTTKRKFCVLWWYLVPKPCKNYHVTEHSTPVANIPQPQQQLQQQPVLQQQPAPQPQQPVLLPQLPIVLPPQLPAPQPNQPALLPLPVVPRNSPPWIVVMPPPPRRTPEVQKCCLPAIPEDDEPVETRRPRFEDVDIPATKVPLGGSPYKVEVQLRWGGQPDLRQPAAEGLWHAFEHLALSPDQKERVGPAEIPTFSPGERVSPEFGPTILVSNKLSKAAAGPLSHRTWWMENNLANTLLKRLKEAEALEKKKKKELKKENKK